MQASIPLNRKFSCILVREPCSLCPSSHQVQLTFRAQTVFPLSSLVQYCTLSTLPLPLDPVPRPNVTTPTTNMSVSGRQLTLLLNLQLDWMPPAVGVVTFYEVWVGAQALASKQSDGGLTPGTVVRFKVCRPVHCASSNSYMYT